MLAAPLCGRCCGTYEAARKFKAGRRKKAERVFNIRPTSIETCDRQSTTLIGNRHRPHVSNAANAACRSCFNLNTVCLDKPSKEKNNQAKCELRRDFRGCLCRGALRRGSALAAWPEDRARIRIT
jgi:hypothetical protein